MAVAASYDETGRYGAQTPFSDQLAPHWEGGMWEVDSTHNSLVAVGNGSNKPARAELTILYNHGTGQYKIERTLAPDEQIMVDFGELIRQQIPDKLGRTLPLDLVSGAYRIRDLADTAAGGVYEGKVIVDKTYGHAAYGCGVCCGPTVPFMEWDPLGVPVASFSNQSVEAHDSCSGQNQDMTSVFPTWWTDNTAIATANLNQINGVSPGTTTHNATSANIPWMGIRGCPQEQKTAGAGTNVCAVPTNFRRTNWTGAADGTLTITYAWDSSSGKQSDLSSCTIGEYVTYPGTANPYTWPRPPFGQQTPNPTSVSGSGANAGFTDTQSPPGQWITPYITASFTANQTYQYVCPCANGGNQVRMASYTVTRSVTKNSDGTYEYTITKSSGESATRDPLP